MIENKKFNKMKKKDKLTEAFIKIMTDMGVTFVDVSTNDSSKKIKMSKNGKVS